MIFRMDQNLKDYELLLLFQIIRRFGSSRFITFTMYLDIIYIYVYSKSYESRKTKTSYNLKQREYMITAV